jgi:hypothetical protein
MKVDEIILEGPVWDKIKNTVSSATSSAGKFYNKMSDPRSKGLKSGQKDIDKWSKEVLQQWGTIEAGLGNSNLGPLTVKNTSTNPNQNNVEDNQQQYADQLSKWLKTYFRLSNTDLTNYSVATDGELNNDNILKYIKKAYSIRLSPDYLEKVSGTQPQSTNTANKNIPTNQNQTTGFERFEPGTTKTQVEAIEYSLMWVGPDGRVVTDPSKIKQINFYTTNN